MKFKSCFVFGGVRGAACKLLAAAGVAVGLACWTSIAFDLSAPSMVNGTFSFSFPTATNEVYAVQGSQILPGNWLTITNRVGQGVPITVTVPVSAGQRFFRVAASLYRPPEINPAAPSLSGGAISLPDAVVGQPFTADITVLGSGPFVLDVEGVLPLGVGITEVSNNATSAVLRVSSTGAELVAGDRRQFTVRITDAANQAISRVYDLRVVGPSPQILTTNLVMKAGQAVNRMLEATGGTGPLTWSVLSGAFPTNVTLSSAGLLGGTPTAGAAESNETGLFTNRVRVVDSHTDRVTGAPSPRAVTNTIMTKVRLSYRLNIYPQRANGPALGVTCSGCHGAFFPPDVSTDNALALIDRRSDPFGLCRDQIYVLRGNPVQSMVARKLRGPDCGDRMPQGGPFLSTNRISRVERWIRELVAEDMD